MAVNADSVDQVLREEHRALHRWRRNEPYPFPTLNLLLDQLGFAPDASIGWIITPLADVSARGLHRVLPTLTKAILARAE